MTLCATKNGKREGIVSLIVLQCTYLAPELEEETGYESQQTSKLKTLPCCSYNVRSSVTVHSPLFFCLQIVTE